MFNQVQDKPADIDGYDVTTSNGDHHCNGSDTKEDNSDTTACDRLSEGVDTHVEGSSSADPVSSGFPDSAAPVDGTGAKETVECKEQDKPKKKKSGPDPNQKSVSYPFTTYM